MNWKTLLLSAAALSFLFPATATAESAGTTRIVQKEQTADPASPSSCRVRRGSRCYFAFDQAPTASSDDANSGVFRVESAEAVACFTSDTASTTDRASAVKFWRVVAGETGTDATSFVPTAASTSTLNDSSGDCFTLVQGYWWIEVSVIPDDAVTSLVSITGINKR